MKLLRVTDYDKYFRPGPTPDCMEMSPDLSERFRSSLAEFPDGCAALGCFMAIVALTTQQKYLPPSARYDLVEIARETIIGDAQGLAEGIELLTKHGWLEIVEMKDCLRVVDWNTRYENNRTRDLKFMAWVPVPNKMDGDGYTELVAHESGSAHLGAWLTIIQVASKCNPRGVLLRDNGEPHTAQSLARISRLPVSVYEATIPRLLEIGWLTR
jgi:hypothetical protein